MTSATLSCGLPEAYAVVSERERRFVWENENGSDDDQSVEEGGLLVVSLTCNCRAIIRAHLYVNDVYLYLCSAPSLFDHLHRVHLY